MKILSFGEIIWDVYADKSCIGGAPFNFAAHAAGLGADSYLVSAVGDDKPGTDALKAAKKFGIKDDFIQTVPDKQTGACLVSLNEQKVPSYNILTDVSYDYISFPQNIEGMEFDVFCFGTLIQRSENNVKTIIDLLNKVKFKEVLCDINIRPPFYNENSIRLCFESASILKISREELSVTVKAVFGAEVKDYSAAAEMIVSAYKNIKLVIITLDSDGSYVYDAENKTEYRRMCEKVNVVSTVGAGDSYTAAFAVSLLSGDNIKTALDKATKLSAFVVEHAEAVPRGFVYN